MLILSGFFCFSVSGRAFSVMVALCCVTCYTRSRNLLPFFVVGTKRGVEILPLESTRVDEKEIEEAKE